MLNPASPSESISSTAVSMIRARSNGAGLRGVVAGRNHTESKCELPTATSASAVRTAYVLIVHCTNRREAQRMPSHSDVVVTGAGPAGLAAATALLDAGSGRGDGPGGEPRVGGRTLNGSAGSSTIDQGATWRTRSTDTC